MQNKTKKLILGFLAFGLLSCQEEKRTYSDVNIIGAMKNVKWKGELEGIIKLDTIRDKNGLYGVGPVSYLTGELLINDGKCYISKVTSDSTLSVEEKWNVSAPFFVYANVKNWKEIELPATVKSIQEVEKFIDNETLTFKRPFAFKMIGKVANAKIHIQNLPSGTKVSSPKEAHQGQVSYEIQNEKVEIVGFFSKEHKGVFTHHNSFLHMHLITADKSKMGHLDKLEIKKMKVYLPTQ